MDTRTPLFRDLKPEEIEVRVQSVKTNGLILLLYKDARCDMRILDETVGYAHWQNRFYECKGNLFCSLGIDMSFNNPDAAFQDWVWKDDCGSESNTEKEKGEASDARKRAGFAWGIGRELYTSPFIWVNADNCNIDNGKCNDKFAVDIFEVENKEITKLRVLNMTKRCVAFAWQKQNRKEQ